MGVPDAPRGGEGRGPAPGACCQPLPDASTAAARRDPTVTPGRLGRLPAGRRPPAPALWGPPRAPQPLARSSLPRGWRRGPHAGPGWHAAR